MVDSLSDDGILLHTPFMTESNGGLL